MKSRTGKHTNAFIKPIVWNSVKVVLTRTIFLTFVTADVPGYATIVYTWYSVKS